MLYLEITMFEKGTKMSTETKKVVHVILQFLCPSAEGAEKFAEEVRAEFTEPSDTIPQMTRWSVQEDGVKVKEHIV